MGSPACFQIDVIGCLAKRVIMALPAGRVAAVFDSTLYIRLDDNLICIGGSELLPGPINCIITAQQKASWARHGVVDRTYARTNADAIKLACGRQFLLGGARVWMPSARNDAELTINIREGVDLAIRHVTDCSDVRGLAKFQCPDYRPDSFDHVGRAANQPLISSRRWLADGFARRRSARSNDHDWIRQLVGLGPGLTPSGDDFLGGVLITLHAVGEPDLAQTLWRHVLGCAKDNTNEISLAHLSAAAQGIGSSAMHKVIDAIVDADMAAIASAIQVAASVGHTSGWDAVAGIMTTLDVWAHSHTTR